MDSDEDEEDTKTKFDGKPYVLQYLHASCIIALEGYIEREKRSSSSEILLMLLQIEI